MQIEYKAKLKDGQVEWLGVPPPLSLNGQDVLVTVLSPSEVGESERRERGAGMAAALREIAKRGGIRSIPDPVAWQREIRKDRPLPGRE